MSTDTKIPERAGRDGDQPLPVQGKGDIILALARKVPGELLERRRIGIKRYGRPLQAHNRRDALLDERQELLDALAYNEQAREEHADLVAELARLRLEVACARADLESHVRALEGRIVALKAERDAARANLEQARADLSAETAARVQLEAQMRGT